jgi:AraC-like DNA-binding protein
MMLHIRNMESNCCIKVVEDELTKIGLEYKTVELGSVELIGTISEENIQLFDDALRDAGLEIMFDNKTRLVEKIKKVIHQLVYLSDNQPKQNFSAYISKEVKHDYPYLSLLFSGMMGINIEKYIIGQKVERIKELLVYDKLDLTEIAFKLNYSSVSHLSNQFKKVTGITPTFYRQLGNAGIHKLSVTEKGDPV